MKKVNNADTNFAKAVPMQPEQKNMPKPHIAI